MSTPRFFCESTPGSHAGWMRELLEVPKWDSLDALNFANSNLERKCEMGKTHKREISKTDPEGGSVKVWYEQSATALFEVRASGFRDLDDALSAVNVLVAELRSEIAEK